MIKKIANFISKQYEGELTLFKQSPILDTNFLLSRTKSKYPVSVLIKS